MPAKDKVHEIVKNALIKDDWTITHDPLKVSAGKKDVFIDLGAEKMVAAEKAGRKIAVEIKSFIGASEVEDWKNAIGSYIMYRGLMSVYEPQRTVYLAVRQEIYDELLTEPIGNILIQGEGIKLVLFDPEREEIVAWME